MLLSQNEDTIIALATPAGVGAISVIRISGPLSFEAIDKIFIGKTKISNSATHTIHYGKILEKGREVIDDVLVSVFKSPNSYTGEDSVEISIHGSSFIAEKIISLLTKENIRLAEPGEFTKRAFLNGRMDLSQAEAVADIINSRTEASLRGARNQFDGILSKKIDFLREILINTSSMIELELDFAEEGFEFISNEKILYNIKLIETEIDSLLKSFSFGRIIRDGVNVALVGKPNVGKSSLLNYLLKEARAIVSNVPGTTRDIIREEISIDGILFRLFDTAGIRTSEDSIEKEGVLRSKDVIKNSDIVLFMNDVNTGFCSDLYNELTSLSSEEMILKIVNKIDLNKNTESIFDVGISTMTGEGIEQLFSKLKKKALGSINYTEKTAIVSNIRHYSILAKTKENLQSAINSINNELSGEYISVDLRNAESSLGEIIGKVTSEDILNNIFSKFCIGK
jgi:tRNA modification GTPase